ncbi:MAG: T9SS type A sorting domain-containing protein [Bacteroidetes bacterium]|nr:T9SS type A sorting domain-containing protein [Bacteroidota bacterium]
MKCKRFLTIYFLLLFSSIAHAQIPELWGTLSVGGSFGIGGIIKINGDGTGFANEYVCMGGAAGGSMQSNLLPVSSTLIYGNSVSGGLNALGDIFSYNPATNVYTMLYSMDSLSGYYPRGTVIKATNNKLYGLTNNGGTFNKGVLYSLDLSNNQYTKLHEFDGPTGQLPNGTVMQAANGKLYGMTTTGGQGGAGVIFSYDISTSTYAIVHDFNFTNGFSPFGNLMQGANGLLYGMAFGGGATGNGVLFSFNTANNGHSVLHNFDGVNGSAPMGTVMENAGVFYGNTSQGGTNNKGVIFSFNPSSGTYTKLHDFAVATGCTPFGNVMMASDGKLYGMTLNGGVNNLGAIFSYNLSSGVYTKIYDGSFPTGGLPYADLIEYSGLTGINDVESESGKISFYPNPSNGNVTIDMADFKENAFLTIANPLGQISREVQLSSASTKLQLNLSTGVYYYTVVKNNGVLTGKILIE